MNKAEMLSNNSGTYNNLLIFNNLVVVYVPMYIYHMHAYIHILMIEMYG